MRFLTVLHLPCCVIPFLPPEQQLCSPLVNLEWCSAWSLLDSGPGKRPFVYIVVFTTGLVLLRVIVACSFLSSVWIRLGEWPPIVLRALRDRWQPILLVRISFIHPLPHIISFILSSSTRERCAVSSTVFVMHLSSFSVAPFKKSSQVLI